MPEQTQNKVQTALSQVQQKVGEPYVLGNKTKGLDCWTLTKSYLNMGFSKGITDDEYYKMWHSDPETAAQMAMDKLSEYAEMLDLKPAEVENGDLLFLRHKAAPFIGIVVEEVYAYTVNKRKGVTKIYWPDYSIIKGFRPVPKTSEGAGLTKEGIR